MLKNKILETIKTNSILNKSGHRQRLRDRFLQGGLDGFLDYEIIEILLTLGTPRKDCKPIAKEAINKFSGLIGTLDATIEELQEIGGIGPSNAFGIKLFQAISERYYKEKIAPKTLFNSPESVFLYVSNKIGKKNKEHFIILYIDSKNKLITDEVSIGTLNTSLVHPREVFNRAILNHAAQVIIAHNHPSGDAKPSEDDINTTKRLIEAGKIIGIPLADHLIVTRNSYTSLKNLGLFNPTL